MTIEPTLHVYLVGKTTFLVDAYDAFVGEQRLRWLRTDSADDAEEIVEAAGRVCYMAYGQARQLRENAAYIRHLISAGHESVLEHATFSFVLTGISRAFSHQMVRHRIGWSFSQLSQQYHEQTEPAFVPPGVLSRVPELEEDWRASVEQSLASYHKMLAALKKTNKGESSTADLSPRERKRAIRDAARSLLPNATPTVLFATANARALRHFLRLRGDIPGDEEMRRVSAALLGLLQHEAPSLFPDFTVKRSDDGTPRVVHIPLAPERADEGGHASAN